MIELLALLAIAPFVMAADAWRLGEGYRQMPLHERNRVRAMAGAAALILCAALALKGFPVLGAKGTGIVAAFALLYLVVGIRGSHGASYDFMSAFWYAAGALGGVALCVFMMLHQVPGLPR